MLIKLKKVLKSQTIINKISFKFPPAACNYIVVVGGDGFMLAKLKKLQKYNKPFYGINTGNRGFLLNKHSNRDIISKIKKSSSNKFVFHWKQNKIKKMQQKNISY